GAAGATGLFSGMHELPNPLRKRDRPVAWTVSQDTIVRDGRKRGLSGQERRMRTAGAAGHTRLLQVQSTWAGKAGGVLWRLEFICKYSSLVLLLCLAPLLPVWTRGCHRRALPAR